MIAKRTESHLAISAPNNYSIGNMTLICNGIGADLSSRVAEIADWNRNKNLAEIADNTKNSVKICQF